MLNNFNKVIIVFIILNIILFCIKNYFNKLHYYFNQLFNNLITIECYTNSNNNDYFILSKKCSGAAINDYKYLLNCALVLLGDIYSDSTNQEFKFIILFVEIDHRTNLPILLVSDPVFFN